MTSRQAERGGTFFRSFLLLAPFHIAVPFALQALDRTQGFELVTYAIAAIHVVFPVLYLLVRRWLPRSTFELLLLLVLNHAVMAVVGLGLWLWPG